MIENEKTNKAISTLMFYKIFVSFHRLSPGSHT